MSPAGRDRGAGGGGTKAVLAKAVITALNDLNVNAKSRTVKYLAGCRYGVPVCGRVGGASTFFFFCVSCLLNNQQHLKGQIRTT